MPIRRLFAVLLAAAAAAAVAGGIVLSIAAAGPSLATLTYIGVGLLLIWRGRGTTVGWLLLLFGLLWSATFFGSTQAVAALEGGSPLVVPAAWLSEITWFPALVIAFVLLPMAFPSGVPEEHPWRWLFWTAAAVASLFVVATTLQARFSPVEGVVIPNPLAILPIEDVETLVLPVFFLLAPVGAVAIVRRFRRSRGVERQQMRWFLAAALGSFGLFLLNGVVDTLGYGQLHIAFSLLALSLPPLGIWIAIQRYRLYDIDRLISRTVSYALVTSVLVAVYASLVFVLGRLSPFRGELAVAVSTLASAALFSPLRRRVQSATDRRFHRSRYDAARTIEHFSEKLSDQFDLEELERDLQRVTGSALSPASLSIWLRTEVVERPTSPPAA